MTRTNTAALRSLDVRALQVLALVVLISTLLNAAPKLSFRWSEPQTAVAPQVQLPAPDLNLTKELYQPMLGRTVMVKPSTLIDATTAQPLPARMNGPKGAFIPPQNYRPVSISISDLNINATIEPAQMLHSTYETQRAVVNWADGATLCGENATMVLWAYDMGFNNPDNMPFYGIKGLMPHMTLSIVDEQGNLYRYVYEGMETARADDVQYMDKGTEKHLVLLATAGDIIRDPVSGRIVGSTHRAVYHFRPMSPIERVQ